LLRSLTYYYCLGQNAVSALLVGLGFLPILGLAALAAPEGAEGAVFGLVITAQSLGTLVCHTRLETHCEG
jgi:hypothetical protein